MLARQQRLDLRIDQDGGQEPACDIALQQPVAVLGEHRHVPDRHVHRQSDEPAEQHVVADLLHQLAFRADGEQRLQQQGAQQSLGCDRWPAFLGVHPLERRRQTLQRGVHQRADGTQRVVLRYQALRTCVAEQLARLTVRSTHRLLHPCDTVLQNQIDTGSGKGFSAAC